MAKKLVPQIANFKRLHVSEWLSRLTNSLWESPLKVSSAESLSAISCLAKYAITFFALGRKKLNVLQSIKGFLKHCLQLMVIALQVSTSIVLVKSSTTPFFPTFFAHLSTHTSIYLYPYPKPYLSIIPLHQYACFLYHVPFLKNNTPHTHKINKGGEEPNLMRNEWDDEGEKKKNNRKK